MSSLLCSFTWLLPLFALNGLDEPERATEVKVTVLVILASETGNVVDKQIENIAREVQRLNPNLKSFKFKTFESQSLARNKKGVFKLVDNKTASIVVKNEAAGDNQADLAITGPLQKEGDYLCAYDKYIPIMTDYQTQTRERLILAIRVQSDK